jgi:murein DD-endopeptidase MepM/ murein hydrolase activator NlpD
VDHTIDSLFNIVSSPFDPPPIGKDDRHQGVDFAYYQQAGRESIAGEGVAAILAGWVSMSLVERLPYGNMVMIETKGNGFSPEMTSELGLEPGESLYHLYAHLLQEPEPKLGDWVNCGEMLGFVGATGYNVPVAHLHLETRIGPENASWQTMAYYDTRAVDVEMETYELWRLSGEFRPIDPMSLFSLSLNLSNGQD